MIEREHERETYDYRYDEDVTLVYDFPHRDEVEYEEPEQSLARRIFLIIIVIIMIGAFLSYSLIPLLQGSGMIPPAGPTPVPPTHIAPLI